jgi:two-component system, response regulator PdtaR
MAANAKRGCILIVTSSQDAFAVIRKIIEGTCDQVLQAASVTEARRLLAAGNIGLVIINTPLPDEFGLESAKDFADGKDVAVLLLVKAELYHQVSYKVRGSGVFVLSRPLKGQLLLEAVGVMDAMRRKIIALNEQNQKLRKRLDEMGLITRAKCLLIEKKTMTEEEAHRYLEEEAMNHSLSKREVAQNIIRELEET